MAWDSHATAGAVQAYESAPDTLSDSSPGEASANCDWLELQMGNEAGRWAGVRAANKYAYDHDLKGPEVRIWWPGRTRRGECNDLTDASRGCWYRSKMLNDPACSLQDRCLHAAAHDGEPTHTYTCPTWIRNADGAPCRLPKNWQACPVKFMLERADSDVPREFKQALSQPCGPGRPNQCLGPLEGALARGMFFDIRNNQWYRCTPEMRCEKYDIASIKEPPEPGQCGKETCGDGELCFSHAVSPKETAYHCVPDSKVFLISEGDEATAAAVMPASLTVIVPFLLRMHAQRRTGDKLGDFL